MFIIPETRTNQRSFAAVRDFIHSKRFLLSLIILLGSLMLLGMFMAAITPLRYDLSVGMVPTQTIAASKDVVDEVTTEKNRRAAANAVTPTYKYQEGVTERVLANLDAVKSELDAVIQYAKTLDDYALDKLYPQEELDYAASMLESVEMRDYQLQTLLSATSEETDSLFVALYDTVKNTMQANVTQGQESTAINSIMQIIGYRTDVNLLQNVAAPVLRAVVRPNMIIDQDATEEAKRAAMADIDPVMYKQGQNIVVRGEGRITDNQIQMLNSLGMLSSNRTDYNTYFGALMIVLVVLLLFTTMLWVLCRDVLFDIKRLFIIYLVMNITMLLCIIAKTIHLPYIAPTILAALLLTVTLGHVPALITNVALSVMISMILAIGGQNTANDIAYFTVTSIVSGSLAALMLRHAVQRGRILGAGVAAGAAGYFIILGIGMMISSGLNTILTNAAMSSGGAMIATLICLALQPLLESAFNLPTQSRLLDLSNPTQPLLHRLLLEAPGTYHHSILIANLAEASAEAIGANPLLARVGGYYHDIGKLKRPLYFRENQINTSNIHDETAPQVSATIITAHIRDGLAMAKQYRLPPEVQSIIAEHHGNSLVMYFYSKAVNGVHKDAVDEDAYRYDGTPPRTREGAIVMLCDTIEAAVRSLSNPTQAEINTFIEKLIKQKLDDGQLDNAPLTIQELNQIAHACATVLSGVFHERIEYPNTMEMKKRSRIVTQNTVKSATNALRKNFFPEAGKTSDVGPPPAQEPFSRGETEGARDAN